jgi:endonuclease/exonuclease/phosphatase family metal-dependent hydrolase
VIVAGDFNLHEDDASEYAILTGLLERTGLADACRTLACTRPMIDRVLFRSGREVTLSARSWQVHDDFVDAASGEQLSDHKPVSALLDYAY